MSKPYTRSLSLPILLSAIAVALGIAMVVGWTLVILQDREITQNIVANTWLLVTGICSLAIIIAILVLFLVFLIREIREVRRQTSFIDSVTHELKSPLAALKLCLETLDRSDVPITKQKHLREMMLEDIERLTVFIDRILAASRLSQEYAAQTIREFSLHELTKQCTQTILRRSKIAEGNISIEIDPSIKLRTDEISLATILENLLDNAVKYSKKSIVVFITTKLIPRKGLLIEISDQGIGIPRHQLRRIFERFYRAPEEEIRSQRGTGLGLYVVSSLVRSLGGKIEARSPGRGRGTTMRIYLPQRCLAKD